MIRESDDNLAHACRAGILAEIEAACECKKRTRGSIVIDMKVKCKQEGE